MDTIKKPSIFIGALIGGLVTAPLIAILFMADQLAGLPFIPFDFFDFVSRNLPGPLITFGIDRMVDLIITFNLGETSSAAKTSEQVMGLVAFLSIGILAGGLFFYIQNRAKSEMRTLYPGMILGLIGGLLMTVISSQVNLTATASPLIQIGWILLSFLVWGVAINWIYNDLDAFRKRITMDEKTGERVTVEALDRRQFMIRVGGASAVLTVIGAGLGSILGARPGEGQIVADIPKTPSTDGTGNELPNDSADNLQPAPGTRPEYTPLDEHYRIDISSRPPAIDAAAWTLSVFGLVDNPVELTLDELYSKFERVDRYVTLSCISNRVGGDLISTTKWSGFRIRELIDLVKPQASAVALKITGADTFDEYVMLDTIDMDERIMLAYEWDDQALKQKHGFPLRIWIPDHYGMKQPKWIESIEFVDAWEEGYWVRRGWSVDAIVNTTSVVDAVATGSILMQGDGYIVPIGGIAYSGARGISKVEISVNGSEWEEAQLRTPLSDTTWVIWRYDWQFAEGTYTFEVRAYDADGILQKLDVQGTRPDGATGVHSMQSNMPLMEDLQATPADS